VVIPFEYSLELDDTKYFSSTEKSFIDEYRAKTITGEQFELNIDNLHKVFDFIEKKLSALQKH